MIASIQRTWLFVLLAAMLGWWLWHWPASPAWAVVGVLVMAGSYSAVLGIECLLLWWVSPAAQRPRPGRLMWAWAAETVYGARVFWWQQPFRSRRYPDSLPTPSADAKDTPARGIVFVHGFMCNRGFWNPWLQRCLQARIPFVAVNLEPVWGDIDGFTQTLDEAVTAITAATGQAPLLVCHSMGGLVARAWMCQHRAAARVHRTVTIGTPHQGTWLARFSRAHSGAQMALQSQWLSELARHPHALPLAQLTCWYSDCDNIVFPTLSATLPGADNRPLRGHGHVHMAFHPKLIESVLFMAR